MYASYCEKLQTYIDTYHFYILIILYTVVNVYLYARVGTKYQYGSTWSS